MSKNDNLKLYVALFCLLLVIRIIGPLQNFVEWNQIIRFFVNSAVVLGGAFIVMELIKKVVKEYSLIKISRSIILMGSAIIIFFIFQDQIIAAGISLGILAGVLVFIFQAPILNFVGWVYLTTGSIYKEGDRIRIGDIKGDVMGINLIRTKVKEVGGEYVEADLPSGRIFTFPNSILLSEAVSNYTKGFPYIWVDIPFQLTYESDFGFVMEKVEKIVLKNLEEDRENMIEKYNRSFQEDISKDLVNFNLNPQQSWVNLRVTFPLKPKQQSYVTTKVTQEILDFFNENSDKVKFPIGRNR